MRVFLDETGTEWMAWAVDPTRGAWDGQNRRTERDRRRRLAGSAAAAAGERRRVPDRRVQALRVLRTLGATLATGWLAFQAGTERRRISPIPPDWERLPEAELVALCRQAQPRPAAVAPLAPPASDSRLA
jgi:hypothetical protein